MFKFKKIIIAITLSLSFLAITPSAKAEDTPLFGALKSNEVNLRIGPSTDYEIRQVIHRRHLPIEIIAQTNDDLWRQVRVPSDAYGTNFIEGWIHRDLISTTPHIMIINQLQILRRQPNPDSPATARAEPGVIGTLEECNNRNWCEISIARGAYKGWVESHYLWGTAE